MDQHILVNVLYGAHLHNIDIQEKRCQSKAVCADHVAAAGMATHDNVERDNEYYRDKGLPVPRPMSMTSHPWQSPLIQPVQIPLQSPSALQQINTLTRLGVIHKLTESGLHPLVQIIDKDVKHN
ncbi:hypothetical protein WISP_146933 [Willisornis vidua]|uniref:Uncharacterized protein n=1 Tax=Willisornis vidua TaxID=1566151 RepID=A0ABQ9CKK4_9PASS|nr:hypothetical protein WISP_146933 [Willisornis vidua]